MKELLNLVKNSKESLNGLARENKVFLICVPSHEGIFGNEKADQLAKEDTTVPFSGSEPFCSITIRD